jgi:hypothetical protein
VATFTVKGNMVTGKWADKNDITGTFADGKLDATIPYESIEGNLKGTIRLVGKLDQAKLAGTWEFVSYSGSFEATKQE